MKNLKSIMAFLFCIGMFSYVTCIAHGNTVPKKSYDVGIHQTSVTSVEIAVIAENVVHFISVNQDLMYRYVDHSKTVDVFGSSVALIPDRIFSPSGSIIYLQNKKTCYRSPIVDNRWVWQYSVQYNC